MSNRSYILTSVQVKNWVGFAIHIIFWATICHWNFSKRLDGDDGNYELIISCDVYKSSSFNVSFSGSKKWLLLLPQAQIIMIWFRLFTWLDKIWENWRWSRKVGEGVSAPSFNNYVIRLIKNIFLVWQNFPLQRKKTVLVASKVVLTCRRFHDETIVIQTTTLTFPPGSSSSFLCNYCGAMIAPVWGQTFHRISAPDRCSSS